MPKRSEREDKMVDYENAVKRPFTDGSKLLIGILFSLVPVVNFFSMGFILECIGFGKAKKSKLPEWKNWTDLFARGFFGFLISVVYIMPALIVFSIAVGFAVFTMLANIMGPMFSAGIIESAINNQIDPMVFRNAFMNNWPVIFSTLIRSTPFFIAGSLLYLFGAYLTPVALVNYMKRKNVGSAFDLKTVMKKAFTTKYFVVWSISSLMTLFAFWIVAIVPIIGGAVHFFVIGVITYTLYGEVLRELKI